MVSKRYLIFCDESEVKGRFYSNFYGGALIEASKQQAIEQELQDIKDELGIFTGEIKWEKISAHYKDKYISFANAVFDIVERGDLKIRIMFTQNMNRPNLQEYQIGKDYFLLYYQFVKHAFGLQYSVPEGQSATAALFLDDVPQNAEKLDQFKRYMAGLSDFPVWTRARFSMAYEDITEVDSKKHNIMQALDLVLGGMQSRLNEKHTRCIPPAKRRSKRARAKEEVYKVIQRRIFGIYPHFNVGTSTATRGGIHERFTHPYRHWCFVPNNSKPDHSRTKKAAGIRKAPPSST